MPVVTAEQVRDYLSRPNWTDSQKRACTQQIASKQARLQDYFRVPIDPVETTETVRVLPNSGLVVTRYPIYLLIAVNDVAAVDGVPPAPYELRDGIWLYDPTYDVDRIGGYTSRPFSLTTGAQPPRATVHYMAGWGDKDDIVGAIIDKVGAVMLNRHDDTVVARNLDTENPKPLPEDWTDAELKMLKARRRPVGA